MKKVKQFDYEKTWIMKIKTTFKNVFHFEKLIKPN